MSPFLAIDQSTSATKALLFNESGELLDKTILSHRQIYPRPGWVEHDAAEIYQNTLAVVQSLLNKTRVPLKQLVCLSITNQRETFVVFDRRTGQPLGNAIVWQCRRGEPLCSKLIASGHSEWVQALTGLKIDTYFPASKIRWLLEDQPTIRQKLVAGEALWGTIDTYLIYRLTGGEVYATDHTNASRTLLYDITALDWSERLFDLFDIPSARLADIRESSQCYGQTKLEGLLKDALPICGVMGDSQAALFAQRCFTPGSAKVTFGSGSSALLNVGQHLILSPNGIVTAVGWVHQGRPTYAFEGITNFTGATIAWLREELRLIDSPEETETLANAVADNGGVYLVPAFVGLSAPYWRPDVRAAILGLTPSSTKNHVVRAALESIAYIINDVLRLMTQDAGVTLQFIHGDGGATRNRFLMQFVADITRLTVRAARTPELSSQGAVLSGTLGMKLHESFDDLKKLPVDFVDYHPRMDVGGAQALCDGWREAVNLVLATGNRGGGHER